MTKKQPTILDQLFNVTASDRDVRLMLLEEAKRVAVQQFEDGYSERATRANLQEHLNGWMHSRGLTGRGGKKMVDKVIARVLQGYGVLLVDSIKARIRELERENDTWEAERLAERLKDGRVGKDRYQPWPKR